MEIWITLTVIVAEILAFRWVINRMPILSKSPEWVKEESKEKIKPVKIEEENEEWKVSVM
jgi:hypothetical protein